MTINDLKRKREVFSDLTSSAQLRLLWKSQGPIFLDGLATSARPVKSESRVKVGDSGIVCKIYGTAPHQLYTIDVLERNVAVTVGRDSLRPFGEPKLPPPQKQPIKCLMVAASYWADHISKCNGHVGRGTER